QTGCIVSGSVKASELVKNAPAYKIAPGVNVVMARKILAILDAKGPDHILISPDVKFAFLAFRIRIEGRREGALLRCHFACEPRNSFACAAREQSFTATLES